MSTHKNIDRICVVAVVLSLLVTLLFMNGEAFGIKATARVMGYEDRLFDASKVHTIDIIMDDWDSFIETCTNEMYAACSVVIDGEAYKNVGIRAKGNTSLSQVSSMNSDRYSFKIEFDQYDSTKSYYGLDKLSLNNLILDTTYMKDFLAYQLMASFGVDTPLCSYVYITVNGEEWGLYLAVEGVEDAFLQRNYGTDYGELYKPDSGELAGGRGNGQDFNFEDFINSQETNTAAETGNQVAAGTNTGTTTPNGGTSEGGSAGGTDATIPTGDQGSAGGTDATIPTGDQSSAGGNTDVTVPEGETGDSSSAGGTTDSGNSSAGGMDTGNGMFDSMSSDAVKLQYLGDDPASYTNIFENAKTDVTEADQLRLIESLKQLSNGENIEQIVNVEEVLRYFVVNNFLVNGDSYVGTMVHNYYLYEEDGQLTMIPWDYNLAYGTFHTLQTNSSVNDPIYTPLSVTGSGDRPMADWIVNNETYLEMYHQYFVEFMASFDFLAMVDETLELITPYIEKDPTRFYTISEFETGVETLRQFLTLRIQSVEGQLAGTIPATAEGQAADSSALIDTGDLVLSNMGAMNMGGGMGGVGGNQSSQGNQYGEGNQSSQGSQGNTDTTVPGDTDTGNTDTTVPGSSEGGTDTTVPGGSEGGTDTTVPGGSEGGTDTTMPNGGSAGGEIPAETTEPAEALAVSYVQQLSATNDQAGTMPSGDSSAGSEGGTDSTLPSGGSEGGTDTTMPSGGSQGGTDTTLPSGGSEGGTDTTLPSGGSAGGTDTTMPSGGSAGGTDTNGGSAGGTDINGGSTGNGTGSTADTETTKTLTVISVLVLLVGLAIAFLFKR